MTAGQTAKLRTLKPYFDKAELVCNNSNACFGQLIFESLCEAGTNISLSASEPIAYVQIAQQFLYVL